MSFKSCFNTGKVTFCSYSQLWRMDGNIEQCVSAIKAGKVNSIFLSCEKAVTVQELFAIPKALKDNHSVSKLYLRGETLSSELIVEIIKCGSALQTLDFINAYGFETMKDEEVEKIKAALLQSSIKEIYIDKSDMTKAQAQALPGVQLPVYFLNEIN